MLIQFSCKYHLIFTYNAQWNVNIVDWYVDWIRICIKLIVYYHNPENTSHFDCLSTHLYVQDWNPWARSSAKPINSLGPSDSIQWHRSGSILARVMAWCLMAPSHHLYIDLSSLRSSEIHLRAASQASIHKRCPDHQSLKLVKKLYAQNCIEITQGPISS